VITSKDVGRPNDDMRMRPSYADTKLTYSELQLIVHLTHLTLPLQKAKYDFMWDIQHFPALGNIHSNFPFSTHFCFRWVRSAYGTRPAMRLLGQLQITTWHINFQYHAVTNSQFNSIFNGDGNWFCCI